MNQRSVQQGVLRIAVLATPLIKNQQSLLICNILSNILSGSAIVDRRFYDNADYESAVSLTRVLVGILNLNSLLSP
jgi:hypothetical protein